MKNKYAKFGLISLLLGIMLSVIYYISDLPLPYISEGPVVHTPLPDGLPESLLRFINYYGIFLLCAASSISFSILGLKHYRLNKEVGGKTISIIVLIGGIIFTLPFLINLIAIVVLRTGLILPH